MREVISCSDPVHQSPHHLSYLDLGRAQNTGPTESVPLRTTRVPETDWLRPGRCMQPKAGLRQFLVEQHRARAVWVGRELHPRKGVLKREKFPNTQTRLGLHFVPFPGPSSSGVWRARSLRLITSPIPAAQFSGCTSGAPSQADDDCPEPQEVLVRKEACLQFGS